MEVLFTEEIIRVCRIIRKLFFYTAMRFVYDLRSELNSDQTGKTPCTWSSLAASKRETRVRQEIRISNIEIRGKFEALMIKIPNRGVNVGGVWRMS
jgi:hypothetical protein